MRFFYCILFALVFGTSQAQKPPDLSAYKTQGEKLVAWAEYCDEFLFKQDMPGLMAAGRKGLAMTPKDRPGQLSVFNFYIGISFNPATQNDSCIYYLERSEKFARLYKRPKRLEETLMQLLIAYSAPGKAQRRNKVLAELEHRADTIKDTDRKSNIESSLSNYYIDRGEYEKGLKLRIRNIKTMRVTLAKSGHNDSINFGVALVNVAELYLKMENPEKAIEYLSESNIYIKDYQDGVATIYKDFIDAALMRHKTEEAKENYRQLAAYLKPGINKYCWHIFIDSDLAFADYYLAQKNNTMALQYLNHARKLAPKYSDEFQIATIDHITGKVYLGLKQYDKALSYLKKAEPITKEDKPEKYGSLQKSLSEAYAATQNWKLAYHHFNIYSVLQDTLLTEKAKSNLAKMEAQYQNKKKQGEINMLSAQNTIKNLQIKEGSRQRWYFISGILFLGIIGTLLFYQSRNRKKNNQKLQVLNAELDEANQVKARFFSILNHDLRSPVSTLINFLHLQKESPELLDAESKKRMENKTISAAENLLDSMEDILLWSKGQMENFKPQPFEIQVHSIFEDLQKHFSSVENVALVFENPENISVLTDANYLKTILRNLTGNAIKALEKTPNATVMIKAEKTNGKTNISVSDNGPGGTIEKFRALYDDKEVVGIKTGLGLHLIRDLAKAIGCSVAVDTNIGSGTTFTLSFL